jgi:hypothetical protein
MRRENVLTWVRKHRLNKKQTRENKVKEAEETPTTRSSVAKSIEHTEEGEVSSTVRDESLPTETLIVKLPFPGTSAGTRRTRKRIGRVTSKQNRYIEKLKHDNQMLWKRYRTACKRYERKIQRISKPIVPATRMLNNELTPRKRTEEELRDSGISPSQLPQKIRKKVLLANIICDEVKGARNVAGNREKKSIVQIVSGGIVKKYRMTRALTRHIGMHRRTVCAISKKCTVASKRRLQNLHKMASASVVNFLSREDNSREMPGKNDSRKSEGEQRQRKVLNDSLRNLYLKYCSEREQCNVSLATFCRLRPNEVSLTKYISRNKCLCQRHQNMALLLRSMKSAGADVPLNPEDYARKLAYLNPNEYINQIPLPQVTYQQWKRVTCNDGKIRMKIVEQELSKTEFSEFVQKQSADFVDHVSLIK